MVFGFTASAGAYLLTFDDVPGADPTTSYNVIPDGYGGFDWNNMFVIHEDYMNTTYGYTNDGYKNGVVSGEWVAYNAYAQVATVSDSNFNFEGA